MFDVLPGLNRLVNKSALMELDLDFIPPAFRVPRDREKLEQYAKAYPDVKFITKDDYYRGTK